MVTGCDHRAFISTRLKITNSETYVSAESMWMHGGVADHGRKIASLSTAREQSESLMSTRVLSFLRKSLINP